METKTGYVTVEEYLAFEDAAETRHEYWIVSQNDWSLTRYYRSGEIRGVSPLYGPDAILHSTHFDLALPLAEIFEGIVPPPGKGQIGSV